MRNAVVVILTVFLMAGCDPVPDDDWQDATATAGSADDSAVSISELELSGVVSAEGASSWPEGAFLTVSILDISRRGASQVIEEQIIHPDSDFPVPFTVKFSDESPSTSGDLSLIATIRDRQGRLLWINMNRYPLTRQDFSAAEPMALMLDKVADLTETTTEQPFDETDPDRPGAWDLAREEGASFWATGNEPSWSLAIYPGESLVLVTEFGARTDRFNVLDEPEQAITGDYHGEAREKQLRATVTQMPCTDTMSGEAFSFTVTVTFNAQQLSGCGRAL